MMKRGWQIASMIGVLIVAAGVLFPAWAAEPIARASYGGTSVTWTPNVENEGFTLTVTGPERFRFQQTFKAGQTPAFEAVDAKGSRLPDGTYSWELRANPVVSSDVRTRLSRARAADGRGDEVELELWRAGLIPREDLTLSGHFTISGGAIVPDDLAEGKAARRQPRNGKKADSTSGSGLTPTFEADQVIPDDLIVQGSLCVGFDCVNNEAFGFDTIRLKENNTRIKFEDTSTGTFPTNDWQLTANDSASGGASKFSIEDITGAKVPFTITAGASTNSIFVDSTGRVGFRTSTPVLDLHVATSNTPAIRLEQNNSGGFTAQTWDIAGNEANFFVRDVTGGSRLPFRIRPGAPTSSVDISADGDVGIGTASPDVRVDVKVNTPNVAVMRLQQQDATGFSGIEFLEPSTTTEGVDAFVGVVHTSNEVRINARNDHPFVVQTNNAEHLRVTSAGNVGINCDNPTADLHIATTTAGCAGAFSRIDAGQTQFANASSRSLKTNLSPVKASDILDKIADIPVYHYDYLQGPKDRIGLIAEDFHKVFGRGSDKYIQGDEVQMALWLAVQQLAAQNKELMERMGTMEAQLAALKGQAPELFAAVQAKLASQEKTAP
ncbi:MAG TPA: tail fiber domain-containing protein [Thermoanaerobaculia bacterium]|nr:tail fiber domain-containing protein [Thermoanaerobaculia bacterium]